MSSPSLQQTQRLLRRLITAPSGVADGLRELQASGDADAELVTRGLEAIIDSDPVLPAERRLDIYANMYFFRLLDSLKEDYPAVYALLGGDEFHNLVTDYLLTHPSQHPSLRYAGQHLPQFLCGHPLAQARPFLSDMASLEWAIVEAFDAEDADILEASVLAGVSPGAWPNLRLLLTPSLRLLSFEWDVMATWRGVRENQASTPPAQRPAHVRVWRQDLRVLHREIAVDELAALHAALGGEAFATICETIAVHSGNDAAAARAAQLLGQWLSEGLLCGCQA
jgi:hypothetical protein